MIGLSKLGFLNFTMTFSPEQVASLLCWVNSGKWLDDFDRLPQPTSTAMGSIVYHQAWITAS
jgi:hypothetical protein